MLGRRFRRALNRRRHSKPAAEAALARRIRPNWWGIAGAQVTSWIALGPSFLPRTWWMTAGSLSLSQLYGYGIGTAARLVRRGVMPLLRRRFPARNFARIPFPVAQAWRITVVSTLVGGTLLALATSIPRQREIAKLVDFPPPSHTTQLVGVAAGTGVTGAALGIVALFRLQSRGTRRLLQRFLPALAAPFSGTIVTFLVTYYLNRSVVWDRFVGFLRTKALAKNLQPMPGRTAPEQPERSGSAASYEPFTTLGRHGKAIVSDGPRRADIAAYWAARGNGNGPADEPVLEPVRAYVGLRAHVSIPEAAKRAVRELKRAGGFEREHLCIAIGTGTGWLSDWSMGSFEYLTRGNCATVSLQYTVLSSALALLADRKSPQLTAQCLYREVVAELRKLPPERRPKLYMQGESLGSFGALSIFSDADDMIERLDGAVWSGTPQFSPIWQELVARRRDGSPQTLPRIGNGEHVRFSNRSADLRGPADGEPYADWKAHRFLFLQHPSDPVVWWHPSLIWREPEWLREPLCYDVTPRIVWWPWVTFWQVAADMPASIASKGGHAHRYYDEYVPAWAEVLGRHEHPEPLIREVARHIHPH
jgi:uncharacterized membrane protein